MDWHPWVPEAFARARERGVPVLLSVGYATCHWCHVMEEESFEDLEIAALINERFVPIKVDREERPDIDAVYMTAVQLATGHGGWPMTLWLDADGAPFYAATYLPARDGDRGAATGLLTLLEGIDRAWREDPQVARAATSLRDAVRGALQPPPGDGTLPDRVPLQRAFLQWSRRFDPRWGGLQPAPKFPSSLPVRLLLREDRLHGQPEARDMALLSLERMAAGGLRDQLDGGFHRYSTDGRWLVPHFEKMLYDNALLALDYLEGWQASGHDGLAEVARGILAWLGEEMTAPNGGLYAATDADSPGPDGGRVEGLFHTWTPAELRAVLGDDAELAMATFGVGAEGHLAGRSVLHRPVGTSTPSAPDLQALRARLRAHRDLRQPPLRDEKILTAWNGLAITALARAARWLEPGHAAPGGYLAQAEAAAHFLLEHLWVEDRLRRVFMDGRAYVDGTLDDHAFLLAGLLELFQAGGDHGWLDAALALDRQLSARFADPAGGYFRTASDGEALLAREKPVHDGALPSGNAVQADNLLKLAALTGEDAYRARADALLTALAPVLAGTPWAASSLLLALQRRHQASAELVLVAPRERAELAPLLAAIAPVHAPGLVVIPAVEGAGLAALAERLAPLRDRHALDGRPTAWLCQGGACRLPVHEPAALHAQLAALWGPA